MVEKTLNTRIQLRYDSFINWKEKNPLLKQGEIAIASLTTAVAVKPGENDTQHPVMFKVGPGNFNDLPWASALAADVYGWAKETGLTVTKAGTGNVVASISWDETLNNGKGGIKYTTAAVATAEGLEELQNTLSALTDKVNAMYTNEQIDTAIDTAKQAAINAAASDATSKADAAQTAASADATAKANAAQVAAEATASADATAKANAAQVAAEATAAGALATAREEISAAMANESAARILAEAEVLAEAKDYADEIKADLLGESETLEGTYDTLKEIAGWIATHEGETVTNLVQAITDEASTRASADEALGERIKKIEDNEAGYATTGEVDTAKQNAISAAAEDATSKANTAKSEAIATASEDATAKANAAEANTKAYAESQASTAKSEAIADAAEKYQVKGDYLTEITTTENNGLKITDKNKIDIDDSVVFIFQCGDASTYA